MRPIKINYGKKSQHTYAKAHLATNVPNVIGMDKHDVMSTHANYTVFGVAWRAWVHKCGQSGVRVSISVGVSQVKKNRVKFNFLGELVFIKWAL